MEAPIKQDSLEEAAWGHGADMEYLRIKAIVQDLMGTRPDTSYGRGQKYILREVLRLMEELPTV